MECFVLSQATMRSGRHVGWSCLGALGVIVACSSSNDSAHSSSGAPRDEGGEIPNFNGAGGAASGAPLVAAGGSSAALPPETETSADFELPHAGQRHVYVANPDSNSVAVIDATTLGIQTVEAGAQPRFLQTLNGTDSAIVLNVASNDATIIRTDSAGASTTTTVAVQRGSNAIAVAPDGKHAIAYFDDSLSSATGTPGSFQDVTVIALSDAGDHAVGMTVGFRPSRVFFDDDSKAAFVVTKDGVSILNFADIEKSGSGIARTVVLGDTADSDALDVSVTRDGRFALARNEGASELSLVDLADGTIRKLDLSTVSSAPSPDAGVPDAGPSGSPNTDAGTSPDAGHVDSGIPGAGGSPATPPAPAAAAVTDLDLAPSGDYAMAVLRDRSTVVKIPIPDAFDDPSLVEVTTVEGELVGSVTLTPNGKYALLYTTVVDTNERLTILDLVHPSKPHSYQLRKSVASIAVSPDDGTALVVHKKLAGDPNQAGLDPEAKLDRQDGYSLVRLDSGFAKLQVTAAPLGPFAIVPDGSKLFILFNAGPLHEVQKVNLSSFLVQAIELGSPPISVGAVPESKRVFVGQDHPDGRITFIDWVSDDVQSVTGFELNSRIRE